MDSGALTIVRVEVEQFKRLVNLVEVDPSGDVIQVTGKNGAGKSSLLDGIEWVLTGKILGKKPLRPPVHRGKEFARGLVDLGKSTVERKVTAEGREQVLVRTADGAVFNKPQTRLDQLFDALSFDPLAYNRMKPSEQRETLLRLAGVDFGDLDARRGAIYQKRRDTNRDHRQALARIGDRITGAPKKPVDTAALAASLVAAREEIGKNAEARHAAEIKAADARRDQQALNGADVEIQRMKAELRRLKENQLRLEETAIASASDAKTVAEAAARLVDPDTEEIEASISDARDANELYREHSARAGREREAAELGKKSAKLTAELEDVDAEKSAALDAAKMPIKGLGVSDDGVTFDGNPFEEESTSKSIEVCTAIGAALNPRLNIALIRDGNDLDEDTFRAFAAYCERMKLQAWVERIVPVGDGAVVIEAGEVKS